MSYGKPHLWDFTGCVVFVVDDDDLTVATGNCIIGRLWMDSENRVYLIQELDRRTGQVFSL